MLDLFLFLLFALLFVPIVISVGVIGANFGMYLSERLMKYIKDKFGD